MSQQWITCPYCGKRAMPISSMTVIKNLYIKCRGSNCRRVYEVNTDSGDGIKKFREK